MRIPNILPMLLLWACSLAAQNAPCHIYDLTAQVVDCANGQFYAKLNFQYENVGNTGFKVLAAGKGFGPFQYSQLPVTVGPFAANGTTNYGFVVRDLTFQDCADDVGIGTVTCPTPGPCEIYDLVAEPGDCTSDSTYQLKMTFKVANAPTDKFDVWGNGKFIGSYTLSQLPLSFNNFPAAPGTGGYVKVCMAGNADCCRIKQFVAPDCGANVKCEIYDVSVKTGDCNADGTYKIQLDFKVQNPGNDYFEAWAGNGKYLGYHKLSELPLTISDFPWGGGAMDFIKICINDHPDCCKKYEFKAPDCFNACAIRDLRVETGDCLSDTTYKIGLNFTAPAGVDSFGVWTGGGKFLGWFKTSSLPLSLVFPWGGGPIDAVKVCVSNTCCRTKEFNAPHCVTPGCGIGDMKVDVGGCINAKTYKLLLNFAVTDPNFKGKFEVWADNGDFLGTHGLNELPLPLAFPWNGDKKDAVKVCLLDSTGKQICCRILEFDAPPCAGVACGIFNLTVQTGPCNDDGTYQITVNFQTPANGLQKFGIWSGTGKFLGFFTVSQLPLTIKKFPWSGGGTDKIVVCFTTGNCCDTKEFNPPDCVGQPPCNIVDLIAIPGDCTSDSTYNLKINFHLSGPSPAINVPFQVFSENGKLLGAFNTGNLPIVIQNFPWNGNAMDAVKVCLIATNISTLCCKVVEFKAPDCLHADCGIYNLKVETGDCNDDGTYHLWINFQTTSAAGLVSVFTINGQLLGTFPVSQLPIHITHFPGSGNAMDAVKICLITTPGTVACCRIKEFKAPDCDSPCGLHDLKVETGPCNDDGTYHAWLKFVPNNPNATTYGVWANGKFLGQFPISGLPLHIEHFPTDGGPNDVVKVCIVGLTNDAPACCETLEFKVPDCVGTGPCEIYDLKVETGECTSNTTYKVTINFKVANPGSAQKFGVWANGTLLGYYPLNALPLVITNFPWGGGTMDAIKVCLASDNPAQANCCRTIEFKVPDCLQNLCDIVDLKVETGKCDSASNTYEVWINFHVKNPPALATHFGVWANGTLLGFFPLNQLPLYIPHFPSDGGPNDVVKICLSNSGAIGCCETKEFPVPDCIGGGECEIYDVVVSPGECHNDGTYELKIDFKVQNPGNNFFELWTGSGKYLGVYPLNQLPLTILFPWGGGAVDKLKICINDHPNCCRIKEFLAPDCVQGPLCDIYDLKVETGDCNDDGTYHAWVNFKFMTPISAVVLGVWANGNFLGTYTPNQLPIHIEHFPTDGGPNDVVKVCLLTPGTTNALCCETKEFPVPDCLSDDCKIYDLVVETGDCNDDGTYHARIKFKTDPLNPPYFFGVWANGHFLGSFPLGNLPYEIEHFPTDGGPNDVVKICLVTPNANIVVCCQTKEFPVPDCLGSDKCKIYDLHALKTPCLCGQAFALLQFSFQGGGSGGFDVIGSNGVNYGNFPYNTPQPIIVGPLNGNPATGYKFVVRDHLHPDCADDVELKIDCSLQQQSSDRSSQPAGQLVLSPNPTANWLSVTAQLRSGSLAGQGLVEIRHADGRLVRTLDVPDAASFLLDVTDLPTGLYRLSLQTATARLDASFAKQQP